MKKLLKSCLSIVLAATAIFSFTACKTKLSKTTVNTNKVKVVNGVTTNGGITAIYDGYLYFINGTKTNDGTSSKKNTKSAICKVRYDETTGTVDKNTYKVVVSDLVGFEDGSLYFFGDFMYYAKPCSDKNKAGDVLFNKTTFMRYDLVNNKSYEIYTTQLNDEEEAITYSYYIVGESLNLVVYEKNNSSLTSLKIGDEVKTNYIIEDVISCVMSENQGTCTTAGKTVDANSYVYYSQTPVVDIQAGIIDLPQDGSKIYRVSPQTNNSKKIAATGEDIALLCIRSGKLLTSIGSTIYAHEITGAENETLSFDISLAISYQTYENVIFMENADGSISVLSYDTDTFEVTVVKWISGVEIESKTINVLSKSEAFEFVGLSTIDEVIVKDDESTTEVDETKTQKVQFLTYIDDGALYKLEISRANDSGEMVLSSYSQPIKLTTTKVSASSGLLVPEVVGNYMFVYAADDNNNVYMYKVDITVTDDSTSAAKIINIAE